MADDEQPYVDPNSGLASQPGSYAHTPYVESGDEGEDPNPDPGGQEATFGDPSDAVINAAVEHQAATPERSDDPEDATDEDELEDPNPDEGGADAQLDEDADPVHAKAVETQAAAPEEGEPQPDEDPNPDEGGAEAKLAEDTQAAGGDDSDDEEPGKNASRADWVEFARKKGASEEELAEPADGGLKRDELAEKYGS